MRRFNSRVQSTAKAPSAAADENWRNAKLIARELDKVLDGEGPRNAAIARAAGELRVSTRRIYVLLAQYRLERTVSALLSRRGAGRSKRLAENVEAIIAATLREKWMVLEAPPLAPVVGEIRARCEAAGLWPLSYVAVRSRIAALFTPEEIAKRRSANPNHLRRLRPRPGYISAPGPLAVTQIDHTPTDIQFVEVIDGAGAFVGRAYLTILVDVFSRCVLGFCLTLEAPSTLSVALCLAHAICPKAAWLESRGIEHDWPTFGRPKQIVTDSAKEFRGKAFQRGCAEYGVSIRRRDRGRVHEGGVVERLLGKLNGVIGTHDGATGRSIMDRDGYPSEKRACLTFADLERCVALAIIDHNSQMNEKTLKVPLAEWRAHAADLPGGADAPDAVLLNFLPGAQRRLTPQGVELFALHYYAPWLGVLVPERDRIDKLEIRYDPRDISRIYVRDPGDNTFRVAARRDGATTPLTLWEHLRDRREQRAAQARSATEKVAISREIGAIVTTARTTRTQAPRSSKGELRDAVRSAKAAEAAKPHQSLEPAGAPAAPHPVRSKKLLPIENW
ncbi:Mu transposase C-terminal domain-containing protein [Methylocapsa acidiphila]|uniref:Mu transposase C-terminal domain-containing protein n=1 Tax=Methylocapsa acidiphila TaxID=133552 RepID=UPI000560F02A|nr:Mu transposase C-terminal domain-containing protein [Methylocapsa acidiphila]